MKTTTLSITTTGTLIVPTVIRNDENYVTLARKERNGNVSILTCLATDIHQQELFEEKNWLTLTQQELKSIYNL